MRAMLKVVSAVTVAGLLPVGASFAGESDGKALYSTKCTMCHGSDGVAKSMWAKKGAKNFNDPGWQKETPDESIAKSIRDGYPNKQMSAYKDKLKPEEIASLVKHIRTLAPTKSAK